MEKRELAFNVHRKVLGGQINFQNTLAPSVVLAALLCGLQYAVCARNVVQLNLYFPVNLFQQSVYIMNIAHDMLGVAAAAGVIYRNGNVDEK